MHATYGYHVKKDELAKRLSRAEGQVRGVARMVKNDAYCIDILTQISAIEGALDQVALELLEEHARHCLTNEAIKPKGTDDKAAELVRAVSLMINK